jgi:hypothetical protein
MIGRAAYLVFVPIGLWADDARDAVRGVYATREAAELKASEINTRLHDTIATVVEYEVLP